MIPILLLCVLLTSCGVKRPLMRPQDIPAYEEQQRRKREKIDEEQREFEKITTAPKAAAISTGQAE